MKTYDISFIKTNGLTTLLGFLSVIFILSLTLIFSFLENIQGLSTQEKIEYITQVLTTIAIIIGGLALIINVYYTSKLSLDENHSLLTQLVAGTLAWDNNIGNRINHTQLAPQEIVPERFSKAIEQLGNEKIETRFAAIYALERIAQDSPKDHWTIMEILAAFIRENSPVNREYEDESLQSSKLPTDIQTALTVIGRRDSSKDPINQKLDLRNTDLSNADLTEANLSRAILVGANLQWVNFTRVNLSEADLSLTCLCGSILYEAKLQKTILPEANLQGVVLRKANLSQAILYDANLEGAVLCDANLAGAVLCDANLEGAILCDANLEEVNFEGSNLQDANLIGSNLQKAKLAGANLEGALLSTANLQEANFQETNLCRANLSGSENIELSQIEQAIGDRTTILPENLKIPQHWR
ncbi:MULTISPECIES: pentapeptide repeat-containing protein [unclassified Nostoc]|uniref:pentapeptide repeat-containing protein n=1 Tax=unclassified Nostoc TaxID=2593658 RepID=UPI002AD3F78F|nr:pentapeptide repeat-containing protein [Nostoc sp. DedQUE03]MDZ7976475.1 pentapeptide repeat-containing protein [Nostoc sp. DedQUE03]MDZ8047868.1 pentapeptide repeat-containing protein [Nostoc sp. DedQUE02]